MNWDTEETEDWISNDEDLYLSVFTPKGDYKIESAEELERTVGPVPGVTFAKVDWEALHESLGSS